VDLEALRKAALADPFVRGILISEDTQTQAMVVQLEPDTELQGIELRQLLPSFLRMGDTSGAPASLRERIESIVAKHGLGEDGIHTAGVLISQEWMVVEAIRSMLVLFPLGALVVSLLIQRVFGRLSLVALTMFISSIAVIWAVGATAAIFGEITLMVAATPLLVLVIATADTVHLASAYMTEVESGADRDEALRRTIRDVGGACLLTSVTTGVGFMSLMVVPAATIRHAALAASVGVTGALMLALTLVPIMLSWMPVRTRREQPRLGLVNWIGDRLVVGCQVTATRWPGAVVLAHAVVLGICAVAAFQIDADADFPKRFPEGHPHRVAVEFFGTELMGANTVEVFVSLENPQDLGTADGLAALRRLERQISEVPDVESIVSLPGILRTTAALIRLPMPDGIPENNTQSEGLLAMASQAGAATNGLVLPDHSMTRMLVRVSPTRVFKMLDIAKAIEQKGDTLPRGMSLEVTGMYPIVGRAATAVIDNQVKGFFLCFVSVMTIVAIGLRSLKLSILAVAPNMLPLLLLAGVMGLFAPQVDTDALGIAVVSFGLAVDDTIHFLHRYDIELARVQNVRQAIDNTFQYTGQAIVRTTLILGIGLMPFALSGYLSIQMLGTYLVMVLSCAVLGDLLLLPALVLMIDGWKERGKSNGAPAAESAVSETGAADAA
jgi:predicted RND superfamily exporter protein